MKYSEIQKKKPADLKKMLVEKKEDLRKFSFDASGSAGKSPKAIRKDIARISTELTARSKDSEQDKKHTQETETK